MLARWNEKRVSPRSRSLHRQSYGHDVKTYVRVKFELLAIAYRRMAAVSTLHGVVISDVSSK
jgi:hypothetical protein